MSQAAEKMEKTPEMTPDQVLAALRAVPDRQPLDALRAADIHREALVEPLLNAIERGLSNPSGTADDDIILFSYAVYLLAKWREPRAYPLVLRWLMLPGEGAFELGADITTDAGGRFLASVCGKDLEPIKRLILDSTANEYCRAEGIKALALLVAWGEVPHQEVTDYFTWLAREGLERESSEMWNFLCATCADMEAVGAFPELRRAYADGLIWPGFMEESELDDVESGPRGQQLQRFREQNPPITDVGWETRGWQCFGDQLAMNRAARSERPVGTPIHSAPQPYRAEPKVGRNDPCPCGSGKKYKKCCGK